MSGARWARRLRLDRGPRMAVAVAVVMLVLLIIIRVMLAVDMLATRVATTSLATKDTLSQIQMTQSMRTRD